MDYKLEWDKDGERLYETGVNECALYIKGATGYTNGVAWNGITSIAEKPSGAEPSPLYADNIKYLNLLSAEDFAATIGAYTYPEAFEACDGSAEIAPGVSIGQQKRSIFGLSYKTKVGNDEDGNEHGYKIHLIYGCLAAPSERTYNTINDSPEAIQFSWEVSTTPVNVTGNKPTACLTIDSTKVSDTVKLKVLEAVLQGADEFDDAKSYAKDDIVTYVDGATAKLYKAKAAVEAGAWDASDWDVVSDSAGPRLPLPDEVAEILAANG